MIRLINNAMCRAFLVALLGCWSPSAISQEVIVFASVDDVIRWLQAEEFWGEEQRGEQLEVPHVLLAGITQRWREESQKLTVAQKKEVFYRFMLPLILHANEMVLDRRGRIQHLEEVHASGATVNVDDLELLRELAVLLRVMDAESSQSLTQENGDFDAVIDETLYKLDEVPAGLALGQAAYESGYGSSRFAVEGNALFGQWTYGGKGLVPEQQRKNLGDHRIAAFDWPFDSIRGYFINLMSHPAYDEFRELRAQARKSGRPLSSLELADGLIRYSERGQEYVDTLKGMIRVNKLDIADNAVFRDESVRFAIGAEDPVAADQLRRDIDEMRESGELAQIVMRMRLE